MEDTMRRRSADIDAVIHIYVNPTTHLSKILSLFRPLYGDRSISHAGLRLLWLLY